MVNTLSEDKRQVSQEKEQNSPLGPRVSSWKNLVLRLGVGCKVMQGLPAGAGAPSSCISYQGIRMGPDTNPGWIFSLMHSDTFTAAVPLLWLECPQAR